MPRVLKIAHRGYSERYPENTMPAFEKAIEAGADMIELDVHLTTDGELVVIHDDDIDRTSNGRGRVKNMTLAELRKYQYWYKYPDCKDAHIPVLEEVIDLCRNRIMLNIEIKNLPSRYRGIEKKVIDLLKKASFRQEDVLISSFDHYSLRTVRELDPGLKIGMLYDSLWISFFEEAKLLGVYSVNPSIEAFDAEQMKWAREQGMRVYPWEAKNKETVDFLLGTGLVDGIMLNEMEFF
jgi:glycerophosphoryl diester phosphodiesterase